MDKKKIWSVAKLFLKLGFTTLLIFLVFQKINFAQVRSVFLQADPRYVLFAFLLLIGSQLISSWRLLGFLQATDMPVSFSSNLRLYFLGIFYNSFLPGGIGGDAYKIYLLHNRYKQPVKKIFICLLLDRFSGLWAIAMLASVFLSLLPVSFISDNVLLAMVITATVLYYVLVHYFFQRYSAYFFSGHLKAVIAQSLQVLSIAMILYSQHFTGHYLPYFFSFLVSSIATAVPVSIGGAGIREYVMLNLAGILHIDAPLAIFATLTFYFLSLLASVPGLWYVWKKSEWSVSSIPFNQDNL